MNYANRVCETTTSTNTATISLAGAITGFRTFADGFPVGTTSIPIAVEAPTGEFEIALYTLTSSTILTRTYIVNSSNNNLEVAFPPGVKNVACTPIVSMFQGGLVNPDDVGLDVIGLAGQSNAEGRGVIDTLIELPDPRVWQFGCTDSHARYHTIFAGNDPNHNPTNLAGMSGRGVNTQMSCLTVAAKVYATTRPSNRKVLYVPIAVGGTPLVGGTALWAAGNPGNALYEIAIGHVNAAIVAALLQYPNSRYVGTLWHQGESDAIFGVTQAQYVNGLKALIEGFRTRITGAASSWFIIGGMVPEAISGSLSYQNINAAHQQVANETSKCAFVAGPSGYTGDNLHYNAAGCRILGARMGLAIREAEQYSAEPVDATAVTLSGPTSGVVSVASTNFTVGVSPINGIITGTVVVTPSDGGQGGTFTPTSRSLLTGTTSGTFTYTPASTGAKTISVTNNGGLTNPSNITYTVATEATVPDAPTIGLVTSGDTTASVEGTAPANDGGAAITNYRATSSPGGIVGNSATLPVSVTGLTNGQAYTFTLTCENSVGYSAASAESNSVTPEEMVVTYATWNPADKSSTLTLSNGDKTITGAGTNTSAWCAARSTISKTAGKWCWEVTLGVGTHIIGVGVAGDTLANFPGFSANGVGYYSNTGAIYRSNANVAGGASITSVAGDVIGILYDADAETVGFTKNGVQLSTLAAYAVPAGALFAMIASRESSAGVFATTTTNFGETAFAYTPPAGYIGLSN